MKLLCKLFGHRIGPGHARREGEKYLEVHAGAVDGIDRVHAQLYASCDRCGARFKVGKIHLPILEDWIADLLKRSRRKS